MYIKETNLENRGKQNKMVKFFFLIVHKMCIKEKKLIWKTGAGQTNIMDGCVN